MSPLAAFPPTRRSPRPLALALNGLTAALAPATPLGRVQEVWPQAVGAAVAQAATPTSERGGVLSVSCSAAVWAHELTMIGDELLARLNAALGEELLHTLRCRTK
jgi:predicted nucleic acid-binding Zn ribbon protein